MVESDLGGLARSPLPIFCSVSLQHSNCKKQRPAIVGVVRVVRSAYVRLGYLFAFIFNFLTFLIPRRPLICSSHSCLCVYVFSLRIESRTTPRSRRIIRTMIQIAPQMLRGGLWWMCNWCASSLLRLPWTASNNIMRCGTCSSSSAAACLFRSFASLSGTIYYAWRMEINIPTCWRYDGRFLTE